MDLLQVAGGDGVGGVCPGSGHLTRPLPLPCHRERAAAPRGAAAAAFIQDTTGREASPQTGCILTGDPVGNLLNSDKLNS